MYPCVTKVSSKFWAELLEGKQRTSIELEHSQVFSLVESHTDCLRRGLDLDATRRHALKVIAAFLGKLGRRYTMSPP